MVSGHFQQSDPHDAPYLKLMEISDEMCKRLLHHEGLYYPLGLGPHGLVSEALLLYEISSHSRCFEYDLSLWNHGG